MKKFILNEDWFEDFIEEPAVITEVPDVVIEEPIEVETEQVLVGPTEDNVGIADLIIGAINDEWDAIRYYNTMKVNLTDVTMQKVIDDIVAEEMNHVGMLQSLLASISPNMEKVDEGEAEAETVVAN